MLRVAADAHERSGGTIRFVWAITENLGDWSDVRRRLSEELHRRTGTPAAVAGDTAFDPAPAPKAQDFTRLATELRDAVQVGWADGQSSTFSVGGGKYSWSLGEEIPLVRHTALNDQDSAPAGLRSPRIARKGRRAWGVLRGSVDAPHGAWTKLSR